MKNVAPNITVIYIASASRSGSTILEHRLGALEGIFNGGEIYRLSKFYNNDENAIVDPKNRLTCTCGNKVRDCVFWQRVQKEAQLDFSKVTLSSQMGPVNRGLFKLAFFLFGPYTTRRLSLLYRPFSREIKAAENYFTLYLAIASVLNCKVIVDSSKTIHQFLMLKTIHPETLKLIGLVRDGRAVSKSMIRGELKKSFMKGNYELDETKSHLFRSAVLSWVTSVLQMLLFYFRMPKKGRYFMKYELFCKDSESMINDISWKFGLDSVEQKIAPPDDRSHSIGGSPSRFSDSFKKIKVDKNWRNDWSNENSRIFARWGGFVNRLIGYR